MSTKSPIDSNRRELHLEILRNAVSVAITDYRQAYDAILSAAELLIPFKHAVLWLVNEHSESLTARSFRGTSRTPLRRNPAIADSLTGQAWLKDDIGYHPDIFAERLQEFVGNPERAKELGHKQLITVPLRTHRDRPDNRVRALLSIVPADDDFQFRRDDVEFFSTELSAALGIAMDYERDALLTEILRCAAGKGRDLNSYLHRVASCLKAFLAVEAVSIFAWDEATQRLQLGGATNKFVTPKPKSQIYYVPGDSVTSDIFEAGEPLILNDPLRPQLRKGREPKFKEITTHSIDSVVFVPVFGTERSVDDRAKGGAVPNRRPLGVIRCINKLARVGDGIERFSPLDVDLIQYAARIMGPYFEVRQAEKRRVDLLGRISHEIMSPIVSIRGTADRLVRKARNLSTVEIVSLAEDIFSHGTTLKMLSSDINIANARAASLLTYRKTPISLMEEVIQPCVNMVKPIARSEGLRFDNITAEGPLHTSILSDLLPLQQVVFNLLNNAIKYRSRNSAAAFRVHIKCQLYNDGLEVLVSDNGIGIDAGEEDSIYEYGYRGRTALKLDARGIGLGLFISKTVVAGLGGSLRLVKLRDPTTFALWLPLEEGDYDSPN